MPATQPAPEVQVQASSPEGNTEGIVFVSIESIHVNDISGKVTAARLKRDAYLYIRQSTLYQVANNTESTARQYDLAGRAVALGWPRERIHVIDIDQGHSGASS